MAVAPPLAWEPGDPLTPHLLDGFILYASIRNDELPETRTYGSPDFPDVLIVVDDHAAMTYYYVDLPSKRIFYLNGQWQSHDAPDPLVAYYYRHLDYYDSLVAYHGLLLRASRPSRPAFQLSRPY